MADAPVKRGVVDISKHHFSFQNIRKQYSRQKYLYIMSAIGFVWILIFQYLPIYGIIVAFKRFNPVEGIWGSPWVGFRFFKMFFENPFLYRLIRNTILLGTLSLLWGFWPPILLALLLNELRSKAYKRTVQTITFFPNFIAIIIVIGLMKELLSIHGPLNRLLAALGAKELIIFFMRPDLFRLMYIGSGIWQGIGAGSIIYLATIAGINPELYESAIIDGANRFRQAIHITLPAMFPVIMILLIFSSTGIVRVGFEKVFLMYNPGIYETADVLSTYTYRVGIEGGRFEYGAAVGIVNNLAAMFFMVAANFIARKTTEYSLW